MGREFLLFKKLRQRSSTLENPARSLKISFHLQNLFPEGSYIGRGQLQSITGMEHSNDSSKHSGYPGLEYAIEQAEAC